MPSPLDRRGLDRRPGADRPGRTHVMQGAVHLVIFAAFLFLALVP